uniref:Uncharacterized protein n=1 Tax=Tanacetum cinerariifolium TaxID=118510 RepID=A0A699K017_TANCI|nr:hypothetical protein [Tanacetum cinerariifolium]
MEEEASRAFGLAQTAIISRLERLSKTLQKVTYGGYEQQLETARKMQQDLESLRKRLDEAFSSNYAQHPNHPEMLTQMQQDVSAAFDCCLESLRSMQVVEEID